ncbi:hypothetical protein ATI61_105246 [Archangium gephyra]|uniref:Uncharacterized protein n=1 Tax=Archangium gephyra TaxID=48 RepID=A0AAC8QG18_9BACT|nr:hypothetical protein [Archangium gephyra]AKJ06784.1 Hypothetical protein AA314_08410 [Archangium gephyra]REG31919.1 hypothetical protein ATI61_105246 [Archangium gephyra]
MPVTFDASLWPLLIIEYPPMQSDTEYEEGLARLSGFVQRREPYFSIIDTSHVGMPNSTQRQRQVEWDRTHEVLMRTWGRGTAFIVTSPFVRVAMSLYFHVRPLGTPYVIVADMGSALTWMVAQMERTGFTVEAERVRERLHARAQRAR